MVLCWRILQYVAVRNMLQSIMLWVMTLYSKTKDPFLEVGRIIPNIGSCDCHRMDSPENGLWSRILWAGGLLGKCSWDLTRERPGQQEWAEAGGELTMYCLITVALLCIWNQEGWYLQLSIFVIKILCLFEFFCGSPKNPLYVINMERSLSKMHTLKPSESS